MTKPNSCICQSCDCRSECAYYEQSIEPVINVVKANFYDMSDSFVRGLDETLENFTCDYFEKEKN